MSADKQTADGVHLSTENFKEPDPPLVIVQTYIPIPPTHAEVGNADVGLQSQQLSTSKS